MQRNDEIWRDKLQWRPQTTFLARMLQEDLPIYSACIPRLELSNPHDDSLARCWTIVAQNDPGALAKTCVVGTSNFSSQKCYQNENISIESTFGICPQLLQLMHPASTVLGVLRVGLSTTEVSLWMGGKTTYDMFKYRSAWSTDQDEALFSYKSRGKMAPSSERSLNSFSCAPHNCCALHDCRWSNRSDWSLLSLVATGVESLISRSIFLLVGCGRTTCDFDCDSRWWTVDILVLTTFSKVWLFWRTISGSWFCPWRFVFVIPWKILANMQKSQYSACAIASSSRPSSDSVFWLPLIGMHNEDLVGHSLSFRRIRLNFPSTFVTRVWWWTEAPCCSQVVFVFCGRFIIQHCSQFGP